MFWIGLVIGLFLGCFLGLLLMALLTTAKVEELRRCPRAARLNFPAGREL